MNNFTPCLAKTRCRGGQFLFSFIDLPFFVFKLVQQHLDREFSVLKKQLDIMVRDNGLWA